MWACNKVLEKQVFNTRYVSVIDKYMSKNHTMGMEALLKSDDYSALVKLAK